MLAKKFLSSHMLMGIVLSVPMLKQRAFSLDSFRNTGAFEQISFLNFNGKGKLDFCGVSVKIKIPVDQKISVHQYCLIKTAGGLVS